MHNRIHPDLLREITATLDRHASDGGALRVYAEADRVRRMRLEDNIALEDVIEAFIAHPAANGIAFELDSAHARSAMIAESEP